MRMWMVNPAIMCRQHLLGEHVECHMLVGSIVRGKRIDGHLTRGQLEPQHVEERHQRLAAEMERRGYRHRSPLEQPAGAPAGRVDRWDAYYSLIARCPRCARRAKGCIDEQ